MSDIAINILNKSETYLMETALVLFFRSIIYFSVYQCRGDGCGKAVVNINDGDAGSTAIEHGQKRREPDEAGAIANACRDGINAAGELPRYTEIQ